MEWINFYEQAPKPKQVVATYNKDSYKPVALAFWETGHGFTSVETGRHIDATHWIPLPENQPK
jgi:hypothetical protein